MTSSQIVKYGIISTWDTYASIDDLFSGSINDPSLSASDNARQIGAQFWDITIGICAENKCVVQVIVFRNKEGYDRYQNDGIVIFDHKEI